MARKRMLDPDFFLDEELSTISFEARLLYQGLWCICDDNWATLPNTPKWIKLQVFPYDDNVDVAKCLTQLQNIRKIVLFKHEEKEYWYLPNFFKHQKIDRPSRAKYPEFRREKAVGFGLFSPQDIHTPRVLVESSSSPRPELKEVNEIKEIFFKKGDGDKNVDNFKKGRDDLTKKLTQRP